MSVPRSNRSTDSVSQTLAPSHQLIHHDRRWLGGIRCAAYSFLSFVAFQMTVAAKQLLLLDSWILKSNFPQVAQVYDLLVLPLIVTSTAWFFALLYLPPKGNLATPYKPTQRALGVFAATLFILLAVFAPIVEEGQDVPLLHTGTSSAQLMLFGWYPFATVGLLLASAAVILWKSITGK